MDPDEIASSARLGSMLPRRMMEPLPNCFSICENARSIALLFSVLSSAIFPLFRPLEISVLNEAEFFANQSVELVGASGFLGETPYPLAVSRFTRVQGLGRLEALLGLSQPVHFQTQQSEVVEHLVKLGVHLRGASQVLNCAFVLSVGVVNRSQKEMNSRAGF